MYDKRAKQDALDLWFSMPGEMSVDDFAAELGYPSGSTLRNWIKADPRHDPDKCQYRSKPVLPKLEAIRRVAEGATAAQAARETGLTPQQVRYSVGRYARGGTAALLPAPARKRRKGEAVDEGKTRRASRPAVNANIVSTDWANVPPRPRQPIPANRTNVLSPTAPTELCSPMALPHRDRSDYWMKGTSWAS